MPLRAKDLVYDHEKPKFLQLLQNELGGKDPARHKNPISRSRKPRFIEDDEDPTYVLEESNDLVSRNEYEAMLLGEKNPTLKETASKSSDNAEGQGLNVIGGAGALDGKSLVGFGNSTKRKIGQMLTNDSEQNDIEADLKTSKRRIIESKAKKIKLSFSEES